MGRSTERNATGRPSATEDSISERVITAVADARSVDPLELTPLYDVVDPDALERLFQTPATGPGRSSGRVVFTLDGCEIVVHSDGEVDVTAPEGGRSRSTTDASARRTETEPTSTETE